MDREIRRHRSTARTARSVSSLILICAFLLLIAAIVMLAISITPTAANTATELIPEVLSSWLNISALQGLLLLGLSLLFAWMGYSLRLSVCILESQIPDDSPVVNRVKS